MAQLRIKLQVRGRPQLRRLSKRLRDAADGGLQTAVGMELNRAAPAAAQDARAEVLRARFPAISGRGINARGTGQRRGELRAALAGAVRTRRLDRPGAPGARVYVDGDAVGRPRGHRLAQLSDGEVAPRWRHPVFDRRESAWVQQAPSPWFFAPIRRRRPEFEQAVVRGMEKVARRIEGSST